MAQVLPIPSLGKAWSNHFRQETETQGVEETCLRPFGKFVPELSPERRLCSISQENHSAQACLGEGVGPSSIACACMHVCVCVCMQACLCVCLGSQETRLPSFQGSFLLLEGLLWVAGLPGSSPVYWNFCQLECPAGKCYLWDLMKPSWLPREPRLAAPSMGGKMGSRKREEVGGGGGVTSPFSSQGREGHLPSDRC